MPFKILECGISDVGLVRLNNEDVWSQVPEHHFYVLADGMGGHQAGEIAAKEAVNGLCRLMKRILDKKHPKSLSDLSETIYSAIQSVNEHIFRMSRTSPELRGMGTTLCCLQVFEQGVVYANVGDSRIYRLRKGRLEQLTKDHSLLRELADMGQISEQSSSDFLYKNILTKAIGTEPFVDPFVAETDALEGDIYLICSDGLSDLVNKNEMEQVLVKKQTLQKSCKELVALAKSRGGHDNVTVVLVKIDKSHATTSKHLPRQ